MRERQINPRILLRRMFLLGHRPVPAFRSGLSGRPSYDEKAHRRRRNYLAQQSRRANRR